MNFFLYVCKKFKFRFFFVVQVQHKNFCSVKLQKVKFKSYGLNQW